MILWFAYELLFHSFSPGFLPWGFDVDDDMYGVFPTLAESGTPSSPLGVGWVDRISVGWIGRRLGE